jgi:mono/diheme cytochrome c family protein
LRIHNSKFLLLNSFALLIAASMWMIGSAAEEPGQRLYEDKCSQCHGAEGRGGKAPRLVPFEWNYEQALEQIRHPLCDMPPIPESEVSNAEVAQIVEYLKTIK